MKICKGCDTHKPVSDYYMNSGRPMSKCKECIKSDVRQYRAENIDRVRAYDRMRGDLPHRVAGRKARAHLYVGRHNAKWKAENPEKRRAQNAVNNSIRDGRLTRPTACEACHVQCRPHGHHDDYSKPLDVMWLCQTCHGARHRMLNAMRREAA